MNEILMAFIMSTLAGLSTLIGGVIALSAKRTNTKFLSISLGFSAGVMIYISMVEIFSQARETLSLSLGDKPGMLVTLAGFFGGMLIIGVIDRLVSADKNPHEPKSIEDVTGNAHGHKRLMHVGLLTALAIGIHNFPEGMVTFVSALHSVKLAVPIVVAIALHNIPEGVAVAVPIYYATGSRRKAFLYTLGSGLAEPVGALIGYLVLLPIMSDVVFGVLFASVAGVMVFISLDELLPSAREYGEHHLEIYGLVAGMAVMAMSLWLLG